MSRTRREREQLSRIWRPQPLKIDGKLSVVEIRAHWRWRKFVLRQAGVRRFQSWDGIPAGRAQPAVLAPNHFLDCSFAPERAAAAIPQRPAAQIDHVRVTALRLDDVGVSGALQGGVWTIAGAQDVHVRVQFIWAA